MRKQEYAIKLGLFRKKVGECIEIGQSKYEITEIMPIDCFLVRKCVTRMIECGLAKSFYIDQNLDKVQNQNKFIEWIQENIKPQKEFDWLEYYKDFSQMPTTLYSLYKCTKLTYEQFVLAMLKEKSVVIRNMLKEDSEKESRGYVLSFSAMIILYKLGVSTKKLNENGVVIPASILQFSKDEAKTIVDTNANPKDRTKKKTEYLLQFENEAMHMFQAILGVSEYLYRLKELELMYDGKIPIMVRERVKWPKKIGRNELCPCGSGKKYKRCHGR